jgi:mono/diheme cytochrome c family protein
MGPGEQAVNGHKMLVAHKPVVHDPAEYGCTVCHGGQGQATDKADAHGDVHFWPEPMLPKQFSEAGCGTCHAALEVPNHRLLRQAKAVFERTDCLACHRLDGRGGTVRPDGGGMEGPDLSRVGVAGYDAAWYEKHVGKSAQAASGPWKTSFGPLSESETRLLRLFLQTRVAAPRLVESKAVFHSSGCLGCHKVDGVGGDAGPDLTRTGNKDPGQLSFRWVPGKATLPSWVAEHFRSPGALVPGSQMPSVPRPDSEIEQLTHYSLSLRRRELRAQYLPKDRVRATKFGDREFSQDGATIFAAFCSGCHGEDGLGRHAPGLPSFPSIASPDFLEIASDELLANTIRLGRPGRKMPAWDKEGGLRPQEVRAVIEHLRQRAAAPARPAAGPLRWVNASAEAGQRLFAAACSGCHGKQGGGGEGLALNNKVLLEAASDTYLVETISRGRRGTIMEGFLQPSAARQTLSRGEIESIVAYLRSWQAGAAATTASAR